MSSDENHKCEDCSEVYWSNEISFCEKCNNSICINCLINTDEENTAEKIMNDKINKKHCPFCSGTAVSDKQMLDHLFKIVGFGEITAKNQILYQRKNNHDRNSNQNT